MAKLSNKLRSVATNTNSGIGFYCPGCNSMHVVSVAGANAVWNWNNDVEKPTLTPSVLITSGHFIPNHTGKCWCDYNKEHPDKPAPFECSCCHSFVTDGNIQFLSDCTHHLAGQTVAIPDLPDNSG